MFWRILGITCLLTACGGGTAPPPASPSAPVEPRAGEKEESAKPAVRGEFGLGVAPEAVPPTPAHCEPWATPPVACEAPSTERAREALAEALGKQGLERDRELARLEGCNTFEKGLLRALRAELAPAECGDALVEPLLSKPKQMSLDTRHTLLGLGLAARIRRLGVEPPTLEPPFSKDRVTRHFKEKALPWTKRQAKAIHQLAEFGAALAGYGQGIVAVEAGVADLQLVHALRQLPIPQQMKDDPELREAYYVALDDVLAPRKRRGRDAALVGLGRLATTGAIGDPRVERARQLLSQLYAGRRINALDALLLPRLLAPKGQGPVAPGAKPPSSEARIAALAPSYYVNLILGQIDPREKGLLGEGLERGLPQKWRQSLDGAPLDDEQRGFYAKALFRLGQRYWLASDFKRAAEVAGAGAKPSRELRLLEALAVALQKGPKDAVAMMVQGPMLPGGVGDVSLLDELAKGRDQVAAMAAFDAAHILSIIPQSAPSKAYWQGIARRFQRAAKLLPQGQARLDAQARAKEAEETAKSIH